MIDLDRLASWMDDQGLAPGAPIECEFVSGGSQNEIYEIRRGDVHAALRIPPPTAPETRDDGIWREWRITEALECTDVPHTPAVAACRDQAVLGRAFYLMGFVDGWSPMGLATLWLASPALPFTRDPSRGGSIGPIAVPMAGFTAAVMLVAGIHYQWGEWGWFWLGAFAICPAAALGLGRQADRRVQLLWERGG